MSSRVPFAVGASWVGGGALSGDIGKLPARLARPRQRLLNHQRALPRGVVNSAAPTNQRRPFACRPIIRRHERRKPRPSALQLDAGTADAWSQVCSGGSGHEVEPNIGMRVGGRFDSFAVEVRVDLDRGESGLGQRVRRRARIAPPESVAGSFRSSKGVVHAHVVRAEHPHERSAATGTHPKIQQRPASHLVSDAK